jgi:hypothetical protein
MILVFEYEIVIVPPGGGEAERTVPVRGKRIPQPNEYVQFKEADGISFFFVRNIITILKDDDSPVSSFDEEKIVVEVEPVECEYQSPTQTKMIERFKAKGLNVKQWVPSGY